MDMVVGGWSEKIEYIVNYVISLTRHIDIIIMQYNVGVIIVAVVMNIMNIQYNNGQNGDIDMVNLASLAHS